MVSSPALIIWCAISGVWNGELSKLVHFFDGCIYDNVRQSSSWFCQIKWTNLTSGSYILPNMHPSVTPHFCFPILCCVCYFKIHEMGCCQIGSLSLTELEIEMVLYFAKYAPVNGYGFVSNLACILMNIVIYGYKKFT